MFEPFTASECLYVKGLQVAVDRGEIGGCEQEQDLLADDPVFGDDDRVDVLAALERLEHVEHRGVARW